MKSKKNLMIDKIYNMAAHNVRPDDEVNEFDRNKKIHEMEMFITHQTKQIPPRYINASFNNFQPQSEGQSVLVRELMKKHCSAILFGKNSTGKTHIAFSMVHHLAEKGIASKYIRAPDLFNIVRGSFSDKSLEKVIEDLKTVTYLIIDEVDKKFGSQTEFLSLHQIIDHRYNYEKHTMLITNSEKEELIDVIGLASFDRVSEDGLVSCFNGENYRRKK
jgi:DNA replication protein DnaC